MCILLSTKFKIVGTKTEYLPKVGAKSECAAAHQAPPIPLPLIRTDLLFVAK